MYSSTSVRDDFQARDAFKVFGIARKQPRAVFFGGGCDPDVVMRTPGQNPGCPQMSYDPPIMLGGGKPGRHESPTRQEGQRLLCALFRDRRRAVQKLTGYRRGNDHLLVAMFKQSPVDGSIRSALGPELIDHYGRVDADQESGSTFQRVDALRSRIKDSIWSASASVPISPQIRALIATASPQVPLVWWASRRRSITLVNDSDPIFSLANRS